MPQLEAAMSARGVLTDELAQIYADSGSGAPTEYAEAAMRTLFNEAADLMRSATHEGFAAVQQRYGSAYANGWRTGRLRAADMLDISPEVQNT